MHIPVYSTAFDIIWIVSYPDHLCMTVDDCVTVWVGYNIHPCMDPHCMSSYVIICHDCMTYLHGVDHLLNNPSTNAHGLQAVVEPLAGANAAAKRSGEAAKVWAHQRWWSSKSVASPLLIHHLIRDQSLWKPFGRCFGTNR